MSKTKPADPLAELDLAARREKAKVEGAKRLSTARSRLVLGATPTTAFFTAIALRLKAVPTFDIPTAATDGKRLLYNPAFFEGLTNDEALFVVCHEALHVALAHHARRDARDPRLFNVACDLAVNRPLVEAGLVMPKGGLLPDAFGLEPGKSAEWYYSRLPQQSGGGEGDDPGGCGGVKDPGDGSPDACARAEAEAKVVAAAAAQAAKMMAGSGRGPLPAGLARLVDEILHPKVDWRAVLREFLRRHAQNDYSWTRPNRRFVGQGVYLPGRHGEDMGEVVIAVDTSGSIGGPVLNAFAAEVRGVLECNPARVTVIYCDAEVGRVQEWKPGDGELLLEPVGGGGTDHNPVFRYVEENGLDPVCLIALTDLYTCFPTTHPDYPVLWAVVGNPNPAAPFGQIVEVES